MGGKREGRKGGRDEKVKMACQKRRIIPHVRLETKVREVRREGKKGGKKEGGYEDVPDQLSF